MTRLEEQRQAVSQALGNQDQRISAVEEQLATSQKHVEGQLQQVEDRVKEIVREELRELIADERYLTAVPTAYPDRHSGVAWQSPIHMMEKRHGTFIICNSKTSHV
ncbi:unnamed protein product [Callosobruchus maculatus]|uniref:Uncharacterized protein n=1 Tax=Callosobruchus maculatus TaxID=64391 RepID=A0A653BRB0_CALMS|nr:unnamed protein product [Callosobruchus maculatus]